jgi:hypothetical protein
VAAVGRRDRDARPAIELVGDEPPTAEPSERVEIGRSGDRRAAVAVAVAAVVALLIGGLALGDDDDKDASTPSTEASRESGTPSTTTTRPPSTTSLLGPEAAPVFGAAAHAHLLFGGGPAGVWRQLDLDTGLLQGVDQLEGVTPDDLALGTSPVGTPIPVRGGVIVGDGDRASVVPLPAGPSNAFEPIASISRLGQVVVILESGLADRVWVVRSLFASGGGLSGFGVALAGIDGRVLVPEFEVPTLPTHATADGVLYEAGGRVYLASATGIRSLGAGDLQDSNATQVAVLGCDATSECAAEVIDVASGVKRRGPVIPGAASGGYSILLSPDGWLAVTHSEPKFTVSLTDPTGRTSQIGVSDLRADPAWLPGDLGLIALTGSGIIRFFERDGQIFTERVGDLRPGFGEDTLVVVPKAPA